MATRNAQHYSDKENAEWCHLMSLEWFFYPLTASAYLIPLYLIFFDAKSILICSIISWLIWVVFVAITKWVAIPPLTFLEYMQSDKKSLWIVFGWSAAYLLYEGYYFDIAAYLFFLLFFKNGVQIFVAVIIVIIIYFCRFALGVRPSQLKARFDFTQPVADRLMMKLGYELSDEITE